MNQVGQDSSMEGILASIKRVIAEDVRAPAGRTPVRPRADVDEPEEDDVLELDAPMQVGATAYQADAQQPAAPVSDASPLVSLVSANAAEASRNSLAALSALRAAATTPAPADGGPLEAVIRDMLRPMLKDWLDDRLPQIVEEIVAKEVARITGKG